MGTKRLRKTLGYRDQGDTAEAAHVEHWRNFTFEAGPVIVASDGPWGTVQVWAASEDEGKRVVRHAAAIAGFDPDGDPAGRWIVTSSANPRYGRTGTMRVRVRNGYVCVSKRDGPNGAPLAYRGL